MIKFISEADGDEPEGFLASFKKSFQNAKAGKKDEPKDKAPKAADPAKPEPRNISKKSSALLTLASRVKGAPKGSTRVVIRTSKSNLDDHYMKGKDGTSFAAAMSDDEVTSFVRSPQNPKASKELQAMPNGYKLSSLTPGDDETITLLDIPNSLMKQLTATHRFVSSGGKNESNVQAARDILAKMMSHDHYVATLNGSNLKKLGPHLDKVQNDTERLINALNPNAIIVAYPNDHELKAVLQEWDDRVLRYQRGQQHSRIKDDDEAAEPAAKKPDTPEEKTENKTAPEAKPAATVAIEPTATPPKKAELGDVSDALTSSWDSFSKEIMGKDGKLNMRKYNALDLDKRTTFQKKLFDLRKQLDTISKSIGVSS